ncbi:MAG: T9SS type A sorting domain-containing protein [Bacteroidota bacterium]
MRKIVSTLGFILFFNLVYGLNFNQKATLYEHMLEVNIEWSHKHFELDESISFTSEEQRIRLHLLMVIQSLSNSDLNHLNKTQIEKRSEALEALKTYANELKFPCNSYHDFRIPYFIDEQNTACAVGQMLRETGHEHIGKWVKRKMNNAYIQEIPAGELDKWANEYGFSRTELAWIQPGYPPSLQGWSSLAQGLNGPGKTLIEYGGKLIIAGEFTDASGLAVNNVVAWNGTEFESLGDGVNGKVNCSIIYQGELYLGGSFNDGFADIAIWDGEAWTYNAVFASKYSETQSFGIYLDKLYAGGLASGFAGVDYLLAIWENPNWNWVAEFEGGPINSIVQYGVEMLIGGDFQSIVENGNTIEANNIALFSSQGQWLEFNGGLDGFVKDIHVNNDNVLIGGLINSGNNHYYGLVKNQDESLIQIPSEGAFTQNYLSSDSTGYFNCILLEEGDTILGGMYATSLATIIGSSLSSLESSFGFTSGNPFFATSGEVHDIVRFQDNIYIAGDFSNLTDVEFNHVAMFDGTVDIQEILADSYTIFPNPIFDQFTLQSDLNFKQFYLFDMQGKQIPIIANRQTGFYRFDLQSISSGTYIFYALTENGYLSKKIVKD